MYIYHYMKCRNIWFRLLVLLNIWIIIYLLLKSSSCKHHDHHDRQVGTDVIRSKYYPDCPAFNPQITPQHLFQAYFDLFNDSLWLTKSPSYSPSFQELHSLLFGSTISNLYDIWPNHYKLNLDLSYPYTFLTQQLFTRILKEVKIPITFIVEVGSFKGNSAMNIAKTLLDIKSNRNFVLLCIDTWLGGLEHWTDDKQRELMPMQYGRPIIYEYFLANMVANNLTNYVIPYSTTSILGARFLLEKKFFPQLIYLDSAHLEGETYVELELYWLILQPGGILFGDDWSWKSVRCDVTRFIEHVHGKLIVLGNVWFIKKKN